VRFVLVLLVLLVEALVFLIVLFYEKADSEFWRGKADQWCENAGEWKRAFDAKTQIDDTIDSALKTVQQFPKTLDLESLQKEIEFHRARNDTSTDARLNLLLAEGAVPIIREAHRYTSEQAAEAHENAGRAIGKLRELMNAPPVDHLAEARADLAQIDLRKQAREELERENRYQEAMTRLETKPPAERDTPVGSAPPEPEPAPDLVPAAEAESELRRIDAGIVAANDLEAFDDETLEAGGLYRREDGIYMEASWSDDPRDEVLAMSSEEVSALLEDMNPLGQPEVTEAEAITWLKSASLDELTKYANELKASRKRNKLALKKVTEEIDLRLGQLFDEDDREGRDDD
jgi:hypothetical protein